MCFTVLGTFAQHLDITNQYLVTSLVTGLKRNPVGYIWFVTRACTPPGIIMECRVVFKFDLTTSFPLLHPL